MKTPEDRHEEARQNCMAFGHIPPEYPCLTCSIEAITLAIKETREECAKIAEQMECEADGYHTCTHNQGIALAIRQGERK